VSAPDKTTPVACAAYSYEAVLYLACLWLTWRYVFGARARALRTRSLGAWTIQPVDFACYLFFAFVGGTLLSALAGVVMRRAHLDPDQTLVIGSAVMHLGILLGLALFFRVYANRTEPPGKGSLKTDISSGFVLFLIVTPVVGLTGLAWGYLLDLLGLPDDKQDLVTLLENSHSVVLMAILVGVATLLVPVTEELIFRAGIFRFSRTRMPRWAAILMTSVLFGALHLSWASFLPLTVLGIVFCLAYERTGSIRTTIIAHALFNLNSFIIVVAGLTS
jgi:membrane protease YdiL (CAAX protease family)